MKSLKIGNIAITKPFILSPLAGISDLAFRTINRKFGCELAFTEMISAKALVYESKRTEQMLATSPEDRLLGVQLLASQPDIIKSALDIIHRHKIDIIDFNAACPVKKVVKKQEGAALLKEPRKLRDLLKTIVKNTSLPVTVKIRAGWNSETLNAVDAALYAQDAGIAGLSVHGRTKTQKYKGEINYNIIKKIKNALEIPVIGSGNIFSPLYAKKMFDETGCDGVAVARGAFGNPWIFSMLLQYFSEGTFPPKPDLKQTVEIIIRHLDECINLYGEKGGSRIFRKFFGWYAKGFYCIKQLRPLAFKAQTRQCYIDIIKLLERKQSRLGEKANYPDDIALVLENMGELYQRF